MKNNRKTNKSNEPQITRSMVDKAFDTAIAMTGGTSLGGWMNITAEKGLESLIQDYFDAERSLKGLGLSVFESPVNNDLSTYYLGYKTSDSRFPQYVPLYTD